MKKLTLTLLFAVVAVAMQAATVYLKIDGTYVKEDSNIAAYVWNDDAGAIKSWPGEKLTERVTNGKSNYFVYTIDDSKYPTYNLIFNNNGSSGQTKDLTGLTGDMTYEKTSTTWNVNPTNGAPEGPLVKIHSKVQLIGAHYGNWVAADAPEFTYDEATETYTYVETTTANLADGFKILVDGDWRGNTEFKNKALAEATTDFVAISGDIGYNQNMCLTDAADYMKITLTIKKVNGVLSMQILGEKENEEDENVVTMTGDNYADAPAFTFDETNQLYTYTEADPSKLASFNVVVDGVNYGNAELTTVAGAADFVALSQSDAAIALTDVADYKNATLTVKKEGDVWMLMIAGEKKETPVETHTVKIKGKFNDWNLTDLEGSDGIYTITVTENLAQLADGFGFEIDGVYYAGDIELELDGDAVVMTAKPNYKDVKLANDGKFDIILTVAKKGSDWTVQAATGNPSAVEAINAENVNVVAGNGEIVVEGAQSVAVYTAAGALVSTDARTRVPAGLYIVCADNVVKKVLVK